MREPRRALVWILLALIPAVLIGLNQLRKGGRLRVEVVGAGPVADLEGADPPSGLRYALDVRRRAPLDEAQARIEAALRLQPPVIVFGLDAAGATRAEALKGRWARLHRQAESASIVPVSVGPAAHQDAPEATRAAVEEAARWWRLSACRAAQRLLCVDVSEHVGDPGAVRAAVNGTVRQAVQNLRALRSTTQVGR